MSGPRLPPPLPALLGLGSLNHLDTPERVYATELLVETRVGSEAASCFGPFASGLDEGQIRVIVGGNGQR